jgi:aryl-alcohol dehydrogenase-like predicted oxidoreductase
MRTRSLGNTSLTVSELCLGTWGLSGDGYGPVAEAEQDRVIERALAMGIRSFETADCYAEGAMERRLGARLPSDGSVTVITKIGTRRDTTPPRKEFTRAWLSEAFDRSQERLRRERVDCLLLHNPSRQAFEQSELVLFCEELRAKGRIGVWGASVGTGDAGRAAMQRGAQVLELAYNVFHTQEVVELENEIGGKGVAVLARSVLSHGLLSGFWSHDKQFPSTDHRSERWDHDELRGRIVQLNALRTLLSPELPSLRAIALRFVLHNPMISSVVLGPRSCLQLDQLVREAGKEPPYLEAQRYSELRERLVTVGVYL